LALLAAPVPPALAECSTSGTVVTCTGDLSAGVYQEFDGGGTETQTVTVRDLTADVGQEGVTFYDPGTPASSTGGTGVTGANLSVTIATSPYAIDSGADGVEVGSEGGDGKTGASKTTGSGNATGGAGGSGALAGTVALMLEDGAVTTSGGTAVSVVSLGGSGGMGGSGTGGVYGNGYGGVGGIGGDGGTVSFDAAGDAVQIQTSGDASRAITGFSRGGNGGTGGTGWSPNIIARGGAAGTGGDGRDVTIGLSADGSVVATSGDSANAISAESRGGSGGTGGTANAVQFGDAYGGDGGAGGAGGTVTVDVVADLTTLGDASQAIFAKSYGGRGGDGGSASGGRGTGGANLGGGAAGAASVTFGGTITTSGDEANGILAQSVGGFSGDEADISGLVAYGADSQSAGGGDDVNVTVRSGATIATAGASADGIFAQSQGGGGGKGSTQVNVVALGGSGLAAGDGGTVIVESFGESIMTSGERSRAVHASSGGGTGGDSGNAYGIVSIGSSGGLGGAGGEVSVTNTAALTTTGDYSEAFFATSVGGGGGAGHSTVGIVAVGGDGGQGGHGGSVTAAHSGGDILTTGESADGIFLQSVGGGGGKSSSQYSISAGVSVAIGGRGGEASDGADVTFDDGGEGGYTISTEGDKSYGIFAQSAGGGGGRAGKNISASGSPVLSIAVGAAGDGGGGGDGGAVSLTASGDVSTKGVASTAISVQSIGNGGGAVGTVVAAAASTKFGFELALGATGGDGGDGGTVTVRSDGALSTEGKTAHGIEALSIGDGGGSGGTTIAAGLQTTAAVAVGSSGGGGDGAAVVVTGSGAIQTGGDNAKGILAQSIGGGGGNSGTTVASDVGINRFEASVGVGGSGGNGGDGGTVNVDYSGDITTLGASATGLHAQSISRGGGNADLTIGAGVAGKEALSVAVSVGGSGGSGGNADAVSVTSRGAISTAGKSAEGIRAESIGGSGGNAVGTIAAAGASGFTFLNQPSRSISVSVGGSGGDGGTAGKVNVINEGAVTTTGERSSGIVALSQGGAGGKGAFSGAVTGWALQDLQVAIGGSGGGGNVASDASVENRGVVTTSGDYASGIKATSQGGDGGDAGLTFTGGLTISKFLLAGFRGNVSVQIGGDGGGGNTAGAVNVVNANSVATSGYYAHGINAESLGGTGGTAGMNVDGSLNVAILTSQPLFNASVTIGGSGGDGSVGGRVFVENEGAITATGTNANAINARSVGGDGGSAGMSYVIAFNWVDDTTEARSINFDTVIGGDGGAGGTGGAVEIVNAGSLTTQNPNSMGIYGQSVGGDGGTGGSAQTIIIVHDQVNTPARNFTTNLDVKLGGDGGGGGDSGTVVIGNTGTIQTAGAMSPGIHAHSVGGGGGDGGTIGGFNVITAVVSCALTPVECALLNSRATINAEVQVGGSGGVAGDGGDVTVDNAGAITTEGGLSYGLFAQSVGGGGGTGGNAAVGNTDWLPDTGNDEVDSVLEEIVSVGGTIYTSTQIYNRFTVAVGGNGGAAGDGGSVAVTNSGTVTTAGDSAHGILAQSVGGGGGNGGDATNSIISLFTLGGDGTATGVGGAVSVKSDGDIETAGNQAMGIFAQSTGGSGGTAGTVGSILAKEYGSNAIVFGLPIGGSDSDDYLENAGGDVTVETTGAITTTGANGHGIFVQSVGGGGGAREASSGDEADPDDLGQVGSSGFAGSGGDVTVRALGDITVTGEDSVGIFAQSAAGAYGDGGTVTIEVGGDIYASGDGSRAIMASASAVNPIDQGVNMNITVNEGASVRTGPDGGETIALFYGENPFNSGNATNSLTNYGLIESSEILDEIDPQASYVVRFEDVLESADLDRYELADMNAGPLAIDNHGIMNGSVALADGQPNAVDNREGATLGLGYDYDLGSAGSLTNSGTMSAATKGTVGRSVVTAPTVVQSDTGVLWVDIDHRAQTADYIAFETSGVSAVMAGKVTADVDRPLFVPFGARGTVPILYAGDGSIDITDLTVDSTLFAKYTLEKTAEDTAETVTLSYTVWFDSPGFDLGSGHRDFGGYLGGLVDSRRGELESGEGGRHAWVEGIIDQLVTTTSTDVYLGYTPDFYFAPINTSFTSNLAFTDALLGCPDNLLDDGIGAARDGTETARDGACRWFQATGRSTDRNPSSGYGAYSEEAFAFAGGFQTEIRDNLLGGLAASYETSSLDGNLNSNGSADRFQLGGVLKTDRQGWTLASSLSGGVMLSDLNREIIVPETGSTFAQASPQTSFVSAALSAERVFQMGNAYLKPSLSAGVTYLHQNGFDETGVDLYGMQVGSANVTTYWANPALEIGTDIAGAKHSTRAFLRAGVLLSDSAGDDLDVAFLADPGDGFTIADDQPRALADLSAGLEMQLRDNISLRFNGGALFGDDYVSYGGNARISFGF